LLVVNLAITHPQEPGSPYHYHPQSSYIGCIHPTTAKKTRSNTGTRLNRTPAKIIAYIAFNKLFEAAATRMAAETTFGFKP
jgi:hypothetical protein